MEQLSSSEALPPTFQVFQAACLASSQVYSRAIKQQVNLVQQA